MSKQVAAYLLKNRLDKEYKTEKQKHTVLINCLDKQGFIINDLEKPYLQKHTDVCKICSSSNLVYSTNEKVCQQCGTAEFSQDGNLFKSYKQDINYSKSSFIEPGTNIIKIMKDGKEIKRDLSMLQTWLDSDPEEARIKQNIKLLEEKLDLLTDINPQILERIKPEILSMWVNIIQFNKDLRSKEKLALLAWSIYYPLIYNKINISIQKISSIVGVTTGEMFSYNFVLKDIFKDTFYEKYITIKSGYTCNIDLDSSFKKRYDISFKHLKDYISNPPKTKEISAIIYNIAKITNNKKYSLSFLAQKCGISDNSISTEVNKIKKFYDRNPNLKSAILNS